MQVTRRNFLKAASVVPIGFEGLRQFLETADASAAEPRAIGGYGDLVTDPEEILDLPPGFSYTVFSGAGEEMDDGFVVPGGHDGSASFPGPSAEQTLLVRNHEISSESLPKNGAFGENNERFEKLKPNRMYDAGNGEWLALGGTTTVLYDTRKQKVLDHHLSLAGTLRNCAGGPTPWNSWLTCEETVERADETLARDHGYVFEVPATANHQLANPVPLKAMGRFNHEAVAVDPASGAVYLTEDRGDGLIYRFLPKHPSKLSQGGNLQAMRAIDRPSLDTRNIEEPAGMPVRQSIAVDWIDMKDVDGPKDDLRKRGFSAGAMRFARGEGMWYGNKAVFFACTNGGPARKGQVFKYTPSPAEGKAGETKRPGQLELYIEPNDGNLVENCDNVTVAPSGDLVLCEDGSGDQYLVGVTPEGTCYRLGHNAMNKSEFTGATFSPDGSTMFTNIQWPGLSLAITGPWKKRKG